MYLCDPPAPPWRERHIGFMFLGIITASKRSVGKGNVLISVCHSFCLQGGIHCGGMGCAWQEGDMDDRVCVWQDGTWQARACTARGACAVWGGLCVAGEMATEASGTHPTGIFQQKLHLLVNSK